MANLSKTRTVFAFTSPRTIEKIIPEIDILVENFTGQDWNTDTQEEFFNILYDSEFYAGRIPPENKPLAARDRINRAPKALGFVDINPTIQLTLAGQELLSGGRTHEIIAKQLFKFQLSSPYHPIPEEREFNVRPYLELLRMVHDLQSLSKTEIAIFFVQLTNYGDYDDIVSKIETYREEISKTDLNRDVFKSKVYDRELKRIFKQDIDKGDLKTRESNDGSLTKFLKTKRSNQNDYADAFVRYLRATQLVTFERNTFRLIINPDRAAEVDHILSTVERSRYDFDTDDEFKAYLFDPSQIQLLTENREYLTNRILALGYEVPFNQTIAQLKDLLDLSEQTRTETTIEQAEVELRNYNDFDDVIQIFQDISSKDVPAPSLFLEWNVWRGLVMLNDANEIKGNFRFDLDGMPLSTAPGNLPDIQASYEGFNLIVEVTMSTGQTQFNMESESVPRHFGNLQRDNETPAYCIFIAPKISPGTLAYFFNLNRQHTDYYGGRTRIVPMNIEQYIAFITVARNNEFSDAGVLLGFLDGILETNQNIQGENAWYNHIVESIKDWVVA